MNHIEAIAVVILMLVIATVFWFAGITTGRDNTCQSIGLEWHKDKCVKVTREPAK